MSILCWICLAQKINSWKSVMENVVDVERDFRPAVVHENSQSHQSRTFMYITNHPSIDVAHRLRFIDSIGISQRSGAWSVKNIRWRRDGYSDSVGYWNICDFQGVKNNIKLYFVVLFFCNRLIRLQRRKCAHWCEDTNWDNVRLEKAFATRQHIDSEWRKNHRNIDMKRTIER